MYVVCVYTCVAAPQAADDNTFDAKRIIGQSHRCTRFCKFQIRRALKQTFSNNHRISDVYTDKMIKTTI